MSKRKAADDKQRTISSFFAAATAPKAKSNTAQQVQKALAGKADATSEPHAKRHKPSDQLEVIEIDDVDQEQEHHAAIEAPAQHTAHAVPNAAGKNAELAPLDADTAIPATRNHARHKKAQLKLVGAPGAASLAEPGPAGHAGAAAAAGSSRKHYQQPKYTPLEQQVVALKAANPGVLLVVEVGYKMRFFGEDAQIAAAELGLYAYPDHNFLTASFPVQRLPIHVRRLVAAGHKVGVVRQVESAALKAASDNRSAPFTRSLTGLFTAATLEAGEKADKVGEAGAMEASQELEVLLGQGSSTAGASYMIIIAEQQQQQQHDTAAMPAAASADGSSEPSAAAGSTHSRSGTGLLGVLAVDAGSGDIAYGICSSTVSSGSSTSSSSSSSVVVPLEAVLLSLSPAEVVVCEPISAATSRQLASYMAGVAGRRCRLERLHQQAQQQQQYGAGAATTAGADGSEGAYLSAASLQQLQQFYGGGSSNKDVANISAAGSNPEQAADGSDDLRFILSLPQLVLVALAGAITHLTAYGLTGVLRCTSGFRPLGAVGSNMLLDGNALRQLEVLAAGGDGPLSRQGSLLHLVDRSATAAGGRLLRRWLAAPLADSALIADRQDAVQALLTAAGGGDSTPAAAAAGAAAAAAGGRSVLQRIPSWLASSKQDLERSLSRVAAGTAAPAEAVGLWMALAQLPKALQLPWDPDTQQLNLGALAAAIPSRLLVSLLAAAASPAVVASAQQVLGWLDVKAAAKNNYLGLFKSEERFPEVFACAAAVEAAEAHLHGLLPQLASAAGVPSLSYVTIQNQGAWMVELPASRTSVPTGWEKVCGTKKVCRYHAPAVKAGMAALARAQEQQAATAHSTWQRVLTEFSKQHHAACREAVAAVAQLDALQSLASLAASPGYTRPEFVDDSEPQQLLIEQGKHPMLDLVLDGAAVGNTLELKWDAVRAAIITGPNMGGKSVLIRQAALTIILAQLGSWVPAVRCRLSVFDGVFSRMGASDCLLAGRSTFAEELGDASHILATATNRSLVIMDELGRGTATHDGVAIATATLQHLVDTTQCLTLFVTHYPEVAALAGNGDGGSSSSSSKSDNGNKHISVYHMAYVRHDPPPTVAATAGGAAADAEADASAAGAAVPTITFLYRLTSGAADASFGLNVAQMAGLPPSVVQRAATIAARLKSRVEPALAVGPCETGQQPLKSGTCQQDQQQKHSALLQAFEQLVQQLQEGIRGQDEQQKAQHKALGMLGPGAADRQGRLLSMQDTVAKLLQHTK